MLATALGAGMFAIPKMCETIGIVPGTFMLIICGFIAWATMKMMEKSAIHLELYTFSGLINLLYGHTISKAFEFIIFIYLFGAIKSVSRFFGQLLEELFNTNWSWSMRAIEILAQSTLILPLALIKDLSGLRYIAMTGIGIIFYIVIAVAVEFPIFMTDSRWSSSNIVAFDGDWKDYITAFAIAVFAYQSHTSFFPMRLELLRPLPYRTNKIINRSVALELAIYGILMLSGYLSTPGSVSDLIIERKTLSGGNDYPMMIARMGLMFTLSFAIPINLHPTRENFFLLINKTDPSYKTKALFTVFIIYLSAIVAIALPDIYSAIAIIGGFCGTTVMITFPFLIFIKSQNYPGIARFALNFGVICITGLGYAAGTMSFLKVIGFV